MRVWLDIWLSIRSPGIKAAQVCKQILDVSFNYILSIFI